MKLIYTNENRLLVSNVKNILENAGLVIILKNEFSGAGVGDLSAFDTWMEAWLVNDEDYQKAMNLINTSLSNTNLVDWICEECNESNTSAFELCWNCQHENNNSFAN